MASRTAATRIANLGRLPAWWCKTREDIAKRYPDGIRHLINCDTGEKLPLSDSASRSFEESMIMLEKNRRLARFLHLAGSPWRHDL
ncbi:hypothetical protein pmac_cds_14 [Medusavirus stheno T3]|uniref:Uncharacterized protein n=1 Tax=Medusavirus stheno T3 TaxID=3069717 RepID=A0A7S7YED8_9VIRU|nr:hypothetical protein pmac_cds_14 [Acanthamoeba castellanii medusavirus]QPB44233.1 hypothetical protein pmac_cds_14 [Medusavirus stheno T3]